MLFWINGIEIFTNYNNVQEALYQGLSQEKIGINFKSIFKHKNLAVPKLSSTSTRLFIIDVVSYHLVNNKSGCQLLCTDEFNHLIIVNLEVPDLWFIDLTQNDLTSCEAAFNFMTILHNYPELHFEHIEIKEGMFVNKSNTNIHYWLRIYTKGLNHIRSILHAFPPPYTRSSNVPPTYLSQDPAFSKSVPHLAFAGIYLQTWAIFNKLSELKPYGTVPGLFICNGHIDNMIIQRNIFTPPPLTIASFDIEVANHDFLKNTDTMPVLENPDNIISHLCICLRNPLINNNEYWAINLNCSGQPQIISQQTTITAPNEETLIRIFVALLELIRPNLLLDYNGYGFDQCWLIRKIEQHSQEVAMYRFLTCGLLGAFNAAIWTKLTYVSVKILDEQHNRSIKNVSSLNGIGFTHVDVFYYIKNTGINFDKTKGFSLDAMARYFNLPTKLNISFTELNLAMYLDRLISTNITKPKSIQITAFQAFFEEIHYAIKNFIVNESFWNLIPGLVELVEHFPQSLTQSRLSALVLWSHEMLTKGTEYCQQDALICFEIGKNIGLFPTITVTCNNDATTPHEVVVRGNTFFVTRCYAYEAFIQNIFVAMDRHQSSNPQDIEWMLQSAESHIGGITLQPRKPDFNSPEFVLIMDIAGSYPSHIENFDTCPTKFTLHKPTTPYHRILIPIDWQKTKINELINENIKFIINPRTETFYDPLKDVDLTQPLPQLYLPVYYYMKRDIGIMNCIQSRIKKQRLEIKKEMTKLKEQKSLEDSAVIENKLAHLDGQNRVLKRKAVSAYGFTGWDSKTSNPFCSQLLMTSITATSAQTILKLVEHIFLNFGIVPIAGVTDSAMFALPNFIFELFETTTQDEQYELARELGILLTKEINAYLFALYGNHFIEIELEAISYPFWGLVMKRYCYMALNLNYDSLKEAHKHGKSIIKGYTCVRRNSSQFSIELFEKFIDIVLSPNRAQYYTLDHLHLPDIKENITKLANNMRCTARMPTMLMFSNHMRAAFRCGSKYSSPPLLLERYAVLIRNTNFNHAYLLSGKSRKLWTIGDCLVYAQDVSVLNLAIDVEHIYKDCQKAIDEVFGTELTNRFIQELRNYFTLTDIQRRPTCQAPLIRIVGQNLAAIIDPNNNCVLMWIGISADPHFSNPIGNNKIIQEPASTNALVALWRIELRNILYKHFPNFEKADPTIKQQVLCDFELQISTGISTELFNFICGARTLFAHVLDDILATLIDRQELEVGFISYLEKKAKPLLKKKLLKNIVSNSIESNLFEDEWDSIELDEEFLELNFILEIPDIIKLKLEHYGLNPVRIYEVLSEYEESIYILVQNIIKKMESTITALAM